MKYRAKPVIGDAFVVVSVATYHNADGSLSVATDDGVNRAASAEMTARTTPVEGDYWVVQEDGYAYLNPKYVFERKYEAVP